MCSQTLAQNTSVKIKPGWWIPAWIEMQGTHSAHPENSQVREIDLLLQTEQAPLELKMPTLADKAPLEGLPSAELN